MRSFRISPQISIWTFLPEVIAILRFFGSKTAKMAGFLAFFGRKKLKTSIKKTQQYDFFFYSQNTSKGPKRSQWSTLEVENHIFDWKNFRLTMFVSDVFDFDVFDYINQARQIQHIKSNTSNHTPQSSTSNQTHQIKRINQARQSSTWFDVFVLMRFDVFDVFDVFWCVWWVWCVMMLFFVICVWYDVRDFVCLIWWCVRLMCLIDQTHHWSNKSNQTHQIKHLEPNISNQTPQIKPHQADSVLCVQAIVARVSLCTIFCRKWELPSMSSTISSLTVSNNWKFS